MHKAKTQEFVGAISQLISKETLNTLIDLKKSGGTLGALSDQERIMLRTAASKIGAWEVTNKTGQVTGYAAGEEEFKRELLVMQALARKAAREAAVTALGADDSAEVDALLLGNENLSDDELMSNF